MLRTWASIVLVLRHSSADSAVFDRPCAIRASTVFSRSVSASRSHAVLLAGMALIAAALVALVRGRGLAAVPRAQRAATVAAVATALGVLGMVVHQLAAMDSDSIASGASTPVVDANIVVETITVPAFGLAIAALAVVGASTRTLGNRLTAVLGTVGGVA